MEITFPPTKIRTTLVVHLSHAVFQTPNQILRKLECYDLSHHNLVTLQIKMRHYSTILLICLYSYWSDLYKICGYDVCVCVVTFFICFWLAQRGLHDSRCPVWTIPSAFWAAHKIPMCRGLWIHLGRGWMLAGPEWGAPLSDGRQAGAGWSPHWYIRCSHHARRRWRRRIGVHCEDAERERQRGVNRLGSHYCTSICNFEKKYSLKWMNELSVRWWSECCMEKEADHIV